MYAMLGTCPDLAYAVSTLGQFNANPSSTHAGAAKRTLRYLCHTQQHDLFYGGELGRGLTGYCDLDWASDPDTRHSTTGYVFILAGAAISWKSRRQPTVARSSTEAEYMAVSDAASEVIWLNRLYTELTAELTLKPHKPLLVHIDSTGSMSLAHNPRHHDRTKHIDVRHHFIREAINNGHVELQHVSSEENTADALTKQLPQPPHELHRASMGVFLVKSSKFGFG